MRKIEIEILSNIAEYDESAVKILCNKDTLASLEKYSTNSYTVPPLFTRKSRKCWFVGVLVSVNNSISNGDIIIIPSNVVFNLGDYFDNEDKTKPTY